jgi:1-deoxy-D-xylulose-5-phosphate reductoisomerase
VGAGPIPGAQLHVGEGSIEELIDRSECDLVLNAIVGAAGLAASRATLERGIDLALANKESLVTAGQLLMSLARERGARLIPVDSEHGALLQCLRAGERAEVRRLLITASGGPFRGRRRAELVRVTPEEALRHPTWRMGPKISIDSATLMNKGLEIIEAHHLFGIPPESIEVLVHPQSVLHALVEFRDGSRICHLGPPDMRIPIRYALGHPARWPAREDDFSLARAGVLEFAEPDHETFPSLQMAYRACREGGTLPAVLNAANEAAVEGFLAGRIPFLEIFHLVERALSEHAPQPADDWTRLLRVDRETRDQVCRWMS